MRSLPLLAGAALALAAAAPVRADVLELKDGRLVEGSVEKKADGYVVRSRFGETTVPAGDVKEWTRSKPVDEQVRERLAGLAPDDAANRAVVARWLVDLGREEEGRALAESILEIDPESALAHEVLGHVRHQGVWRTPDEAKRAEGLERHGDRWYSAEEWKNLQGADREKVLAEERTAESRRRTAAVNEAVRLMTSPDPLVRARGKARLESLAAEYEAPSLRDLAKNVEAYVKTADELAAAAADPDGALVTGELRITLTKLKRPIQTFETSLASGPITAASPVKIQLPELEVIKIRTTMAMPAAVTR
jgi:hypothetical protein